MRSWDLGREGNLFKVTVVLICLKIYLFLFMAVLGLHCCASTFSSCSEQGLLSSCREMSFHCSDFSCFRTWALGVWASVTAVHAFSMLWYTGLVALWHVGLSLTRDWTHVPWIDRWKIYHWNTREAPKLLRWFLVNWKDKNIFYDQVAHVLKYFIV